jgi:hypothetical protein
MLQLDQTEESKAYRISHHSLLAIEQVA